MYVDFDNNMKGVISTV